MGRFRGIEVHERDLRGVRAFQTEPSRSEVAELEWATVDVVRAMRPAAEEKRMVVERKNVS